MVQRRKGPVKNKTKNDENYLSVQEKILTILTKRQVLSNVEIATELQITRQKSHYHLKKLLKKGSIIKANNKYYINPCQKTLDGYESAAQNVDIGELHRFDYLTYKVPLKNPHDYFFKRFQWSDINTKFKNGVIYSFDDICKKRKITLQFYKSNNGGSASVSLIFSKAYFQGELKEAQDYYQGLAFAYLKKFQYEHKRFELDFRFEQIKITKGEYFISKAPPKLQGIVFRGKNFRLDDSDKDGTEIEAPINDPNALKAAQYLDNIEDTIEFEVKGKIRSLSSLIKRSDKRSQKTVALLNMIDHELTVIHKRMEVVEKRDMGNNMFG